MTSLNAIQLLRPTYSIDYEQSGSTSTIHSRNSSFDGPRGGAGNNNAYDNESDDEKTDDEELQRGQSLTRRYLNAPGTPGGYDPNASDTTLSTSLTSLYNHSNTSNTSVSFHHRTKGGSDPPAPAPTVRYPGLALLTPVDTRATSNSYNSYERTSGKSQKTPSAVGINHALKLGFLSTLGPGIPVTPTASVFGEDLNGFISRNPSNPGGLFGYLPEEEKQLVRKIDWRILPILGMFYAVASLNRVNLLNARMFAFENALHVSPEQYSWVMALFYVGYGLAEIPSSLALLYLTPKVWLPASMFVWGCITFMLAWTKGFHLLLVGRFFLGVAEAALIPGVLIYISMFYKRSEQTLRMAILQAFSSGAGALGGLISRGMGHLDGKLDLLGWQWIFIVESLATVILAVAAWFLLTKSPESAPWLNQRETSIAIYRIRNDTKIKVTRRISRLNIVAALKDPKVYLFVAINLCISISIVSTAGINSRAWMGLAIALKDGNPTTQDVYPISPNSTFVPSLPFEAVSAVQSLRSYIQVELASLVVQNPTNDARLLAQLLSSPTYIMGAISSFSMAILADRTQQRGYILMSLALVMAAAYCMQLLTLNAYVNYAGVLLLSIGQMPMTPIVTSWLTTNLGGYAKRSIAVGLFLLSSSVGGVFGSQLYKSWDGPQYTKGHLISISLMVMVICLAILQRLSLRRENNRRNYSVSFGVNPLKYLSKAELRDLNDKHPAFRYTL